MENNSENIFTVENSSIVNTKNDSNNNRKDISDSNSDSSEESNEDELSKFTKYFYTFLLCYANLSYGISMTCLSPALLDFTCVLDTSSELVSHYYTLYAVGVIIGSCFGFLFKYVNRQFILVLALFLYGLVTCLLPVSPDFIVFYLFGLIGGMGAGALDVVQTVWLIEMWGELSGSILQLSEMSFGIGIFIGPFIIQPYVFDEYDCDYESHEKLNQTLNFTEKDRHWFGQQLIAPFAISGSLQLLSAISFAVMYFFHRYIPISKEEEKEVIEKEIEEVLKPIEKLYQRRYTVHILDNKPEVRMGSMKRSNAMVPRYSIQITGNRKFGGSLRNPDSTRFNNQTAIKRRFSSFHADHQLYTPPKQLPKRLIIALGALCFAAALVCEAAYIDFSPTYFRYYADVERKFRTIFPLIFTFQLTIASGTAMLLSSMTAAYTLTRACSIFIAIRVRPQIILSVHYVIIYLSIFVLWFANHDSDNHIISWIGNILFGIGIATFWSATFSHIENYFEITDRVGTLYVALLGLLEIITQFIEGPFLEETPVVLIFYCFGAISVSLFCFLAIRVIVFLYNRKTENKDNYYSDSINNNNQFNANQTTRI